jgi:hypothetical protein
MAKRHADRDIEKSLDELGPELRKAARAVASDAPPKDLLERAVAAARRVAMPGVQPRPQAPHARRRHRWVGWSTVGCASVAAVASAWFFAPGFKTGPVPPTEIVAPALPPASRRELPTAWAYHEALCRSPEDLDALLDRHARQSLRPDPRSLPLTVLSSRSQPML